MRFGLDIAQQRMSWDELVRRVRLAEDLGFDGVWGFDHFQPMYGDGPGETFEGHDDAGRPVGTDLADPARAPRHRCHLPASVGARRTGRDDRPRVAWAAGAGPRRGLVREGAPRARDPVPADVRALRSARRHPRDRHSLVHRRCRLLRGQTGLAARRIPAPPTGAAPAPAHLDRRDRPPAHAPAGRPLSPTSGTASARRTRCATPTLASTSWPRPPAANRVHPAGRIAVPRRSRPGPASTRPSGATPATATWSAGGPDRARRRSSRSSVTCSRSSPR